MGTGQLLKACSLLECRGGAGPRRLLEGPEEEMCCYWLHRAVSSGLKPGQYYNIILSIILYRFNLFANSIGTTLCLVWCIGA